MSLAVVRHEGDQVADVAANGWRDHLDVALLTRLGWDSATQVISPPPNQPFLTWTKCKKAGCEGARTSTERSFGHPDLCAGCRRRLPQDLTDYDTWLATPKDWTDRRAVERDCAVGDCERPRSAASGLCVSHESVRRSRKVSVTDFLTDPAVRPYPSLGPCAVASCARRAVYTSMLCDPHRRRWAQASAADPKLRRPRWDRIAAPVVPGNQISLRGIHETAQTEFLLGLQARSQGGVMTPIHALRSVAQWVRESEATTLLGVVSPTSPVGTRGGYAHTVLADMQDLLLASRLTPAGERPKPVWDMRAYELSGTVDFSAIAQPWLRESIKSWVEEEIPKRRGSGVTGTLRAYVSRVVLLSRSLRENRPDGGQDPSTLGRRDIVQFLTFLGMLAERGEVSEASRCMIAAQTRRLLIDFREFGFAMPGGPAHRLGVDFSLRRNDVPEMPENEDVGRALPEPVMAQLISRLPDLGVLTKSPTAGAATELVMRTGRRPDEICALPFDPVVLDSDGGYSLVYTDFKNNRTGCRLQIRSEDLDVIRRQQEWVSSTWPGNDLSRMPLFPRTTRNATGYFRISDKSLNAAHRKWADAMDPIRVNADDGSEFVFDRSAVFLYAYRHTYAQRHADAGTPPDVLRELMGHRDLVTTQTYYRITDARRRNAVDRLLPLQTDINGNPTWSQRADDTSSAVRYLVGHVTTPLGGCFEPSNIAAGGNACPFRMRCLGCDHFRTDPSYIPELQAHLDGLLRDRERLQAATGIAEWAREDAMPSDAEIATTRRLIAEQRQKLELLDGDARQAVDAAVTVVRKSRQLVSLGMPTIRQMP